MSQSVVVASDKFKGSLRADQIADHLTAGLRAVDPDMTVVVVPVADGGDGTLAAAIAAGFTRVGVRVAGPTGGDVDAAIGVRGNVAVVELATASGLSLLGERDLRALDATSRGTGELIRAALDMGSTEIVLGVGGSACTDGGAGMLQALGAQLLDSKGAELEPGGAALARLQTVDFSTLDPRLRSVRLVLASDVDNPLLGPRGAVQTYGPQKGATTEDLTTLERAMARWAQLVSPSAAELPGAGAAGGVGFAALAILGAERRPGVDVVLDLVRFRDQITGSGLIITGEGSLDEQTLHGKAPMGVTTAAWLAGVPVVAICGQCHLDDARLAQVGIERAYALTDVEPDLSRCIAQPGPLIEQIGRRIAMEWMAKLRSR